MTLPSRHPADLCQDNARLDLLLSTLSNLGLKLTFSGGFDNARGEEFRLKLMQKFAVRDLDTKSSYIINAGSFDIALIGIDAKTTRDELSILLNKLKTQKRVKAIVAISRLARERTKNYFRIIWRSI